MLAPATLSVRTILRAVLVVIGVALALYLIYVLRRPITWIVIAGFIAIALSGPIGLLERRIHRRGLATAIVYVVLILVPIGLGALILPPLIREANALVDDLPGYAAQVQEFVRSNPTLRDLEADFDLTGKLQEQAETLPGRLGNAAGVLSDVSLGLVNSIFALVTILILSVFLVGSGRGWIDAGSRCARPRRRSGCAARRSGSRRRSAPTSPARSPRRSSRA